MTRVQRLHWDALADAGEWRATGGRRYALWPAPLDADACLAEAGFSDFADSDAEWERDFAEIAARLRRGLKALAGEAIVGCPRENHGWLARWWRRRAAAHGDEMLLYAAHEDRDGAWESAYGTPPKAALRVSDGHPIFWLWLGSDDTAFFEKLARDAAGGREVVHTPLRWGALRP